MYLLGYSLILCLGLAVSRLLKHFDKLLGARLFESAMPYHFTNE